MNRGYNEKKLIKAAEEISLKSREEILEKTVKGREKDTTVFVCDWHPGLAQLPGMIKKAPQHSAESS